jgi:hypothetical protein
VEPERLLVALRGPLRGGVVLPSGLPESGKIAPYPGSIYAKTLSFFGASRACSIDFGHFDPMFRLNAALGRNAIPWFAARQRKTEPPAS